MGFKWALDMITYTPSETSGKDLFLPSEIPELMSLVLFYVDLILISRSQSLHNNPDVNFLLLSLRVDLL